ncbi:MAG: FAD-dependent monooxygenase [Gammaproteobacteria bacterium]
MSTDCDVLIAGAGPAGAALACALAPLPLRVWLVDAAPPAAAGQPDRRALALGLGSQRILQGLGVWSALAPQAAPIARLEVTEKGWPGVTRMAAAQIGAPALGWVVGDLVLQRALLARVAKTAVTRRAAAVTALAPRDGALGVTLTGPEGDTAVSARLLVAADGSDSTVCRLAGLPRQARQIQDSVLLAQLSTDRPHAGTAHERFAASGPMALLPGPAACGYTLVWTLPHERADDLAALPPRHLAPIAQEAFGWRAGKFLGLSNPRSVRLAESWLAQATGERVLAIGNAANTLHPIAAQGFNLGLRDVAEVAGLLAAAGEVDPGAAGVLAGYQRARQADWRQLRQVTGWLPRLFENPAPPLAGARGLGLAALDLLVPVKRRLMRRAMGLGGAQNRLQRGRWP